MAFYPSIDYVGAGQAIANQWSDLPRVDRERDETDMRRQLQNKQMSLYDLQARKAEMEMEEMKREQEFNRTLSGDIVARQAAGDFNPSIGQTVTPDYSRSLGDEGYSVPGEKTVSTTTPPKLNMPDYMVQKYLAGGRFKDALGMQKESRLLEYEQEKIFNQRMDSISKAAKISPTLANTMKEMYAKTDERFKMFGNIVKTEEGVSSWPITNPLTGKVEALQILDSDGKPHGSPYKLNDGGFDPKDVNSLQKATAALALAKTPEELSQAKSLVKGMQAALTWERQMQAANPIREPKTPEEQRAKQIDLQIKEKRLGDLENKLSPKEFRDYTNAQGSLRTIEQKELEGMIVDKKAAEKIKAKHLKTITDLESKAGEKQGLGTPQKTNTNPLSGKPPGRYKVNGKIISWDGAKEL